MQEDGTISQHSQFLRCDRYVKEEKIIPAECQIFDFSRLPWVTFICILKFLRIRELCRFSLVNKLWYKACHDPSLWRCLDLSKYSTIVDEDLIRFTSFSNNVISLKISHCRLVTDAGVCSALKQCTSLVDCSITNCRTLSDDVLEVFGECCHSLKRLDVTLCLAFSDYGMKKLCEGCHELEEITIDQCSKMTDDSLVYLANYSTGLKYISASNIANFTDDGVAALVQGCPSLQTLRFPLCSGLTNQIMVQIKRHCQRILYLDVRGVVLEDQDICGLLGTFSQLETLNLGLCHNLTDVSAKEIGMYCKKLKHLFLVHNKVTDEGLLHLSKHCHGLLHLDVSWSEAVTEVGAKHVLTGCQKLRHLGLFRCDHVSESAVNELSSQFPHVFISTPRTEMEKVYHRKENVT